MINLIYQLIRTARPRQWLKNFSVFAAPLFAGTLFHPEIFSLALKAFFAYCLVSSGGYFVNDILDSPRDKLHPIKKNRPIASGKLPISIAWISAFILIISSIVYAALNIGSYFTLSILMYLLVQIMYSLYFRNVIILDSLVVASLFVLRVFAGGFATNTSISSWLALTTIGISLLLAFGKRRSEKTIVAKYAGSEGKTRETLKHYPDSLLDSIITMASTYTIITYSLFVFQVSPQGTEKHIMSFLPSILRSPKWMMLTIPLVLYGVARYLYVIYEKNEAESPERVLLSDRPLLISVVLWGLFVTSIIYLMPLI